MLQEKLLLNNNPLLKKLRLDFKKKVEGLVNFYLKHKNLNIKLTTVSEHAINYVYHKFLVDYYKIQQTDNLPYLLKPDLNNVFNGIKIKFNYYENLDLWMLGNVHEYLLGLKGELTSDNLFTYDNKGGTRVKSASFFTPPVLSNFLTKITLQKYEKYHILNEITVKNLKILDPAIGSANLIIDLINTLAKKFPNTPNLKSYLTQNCVYGVELLQSTALLAQALLWLNAEDRSIEIKNIKNGDSLAYFDFDAEFDVKEFDIVIANPPWMKLIGYDENYKNLIKSRFPYKDETTMNTYKYFWQLCHVKTKPNGIYSLICPDGIFTDKGCLEMRRVAYQELECLYGFINGLKLFEDIDSQVSYTISCYKKNKTQVSFTLINNLFHPETVEKCPLESAHAPYPGVKTPTGEFNLNGHPHRMVRVDTKLLAQLSRFSGKARNPLEAVLPIIHGEPERAILQTLAAHPAKLAGQQTHFSTQFDETHSPKNGYITRQTATAPSLNQAVYTGPNLFVGHPAYKTPNSGCKNNADYSAVDLNTIPNDFFPATVYHITPAGLNSGEYKSQTPWGSAHCQEYRLYSRRMVNTTGARTLQSALIPPGPSHINGVTSLSFQDPGELALHSGLFCSLIFDFLMRVLCGGNIDKSNLHLTPALTPEQWRNPLVPAIQVRALRLSSISTYYADLWNQVYTSKFNNLELVSPYQPVLSYSSLTNIWERETCIRGKKEREQALCEIDAMVAVLFGIPKETLLNLYRAQFGVLQKNLQDLVSQKIIESKYHFPRANQMIAAYEQVENFIL